MQRLVWLLIALFLSVVPMARADNGKVVQDLEELFQPGLSWLDVKLASDQMVDPTADHLGARLLFEKMSAALKERVRLEQPQNAHQKLALLNRYVYVAGAWNDFRPFRYDMDDPFGKEVTHKTLAHYIQTRKGNCVSMPILLALLGREIGLDMTLSTAPMHVLAKLMDDGGKVWNIEATSGGGYARDLHYRKNLPMTDAAVENGVYLRTLTEQESLTVMTFTVVESLMQQRRWEETIGVSDVLLKQDPKQVLPMIARASAYGKLMEILQDSSRAVQLPMANEMLQIYYEMNQQGFSEAERLGWTEKDGLPELWPPYEGAE